jgi:holo-[acyl-carrier protein] synthase
MIQIPDLLPMLPATVLTQLRGIGTDLVEIEEFRAYPLVNYPRFYERIFTTAEIKYCQSYADPAERFAVRFAAKEAVLKAFSGEIYLDQIEIEVANEANGQPGVLLHSPIAQEVQIFISLSHSQSHALAFAVALNKPKTR